ncbi:MAG: PepSY-associated TM helix domain-containing protein [Marinilabiliaceae bacterium]|nr:PepSY-associated TM helix domain-containing protein [Marinilabiliaceae bacterium]
MFWNKKKVQRWFRVLHRDIGYLAVGITLVYALSGFFLSHKNLFSATKTKGFTIGFPKKLQDEAFIKYWNSNIPIVINHYKESDSQIKLFLESGIGYYNKTSGEAYYEIYKKRTLITFLNQLHNNKKKGWICIADMYAFLLIFLAISGLGIVNGRNGFLNRGVWLMVLGIVLVLIFVWVD